MPMLRIAMRDLGAEYARIFGQTKQAEEPGRSRLCKVCGDWHRLDRPWPHNCRKEAPPRSKLAAPMLAPVFDPFVTVGGKDSATYIPDRKAKREYMARNDLAEYDEGVGKTAEWVEQIEYERQLVADIKRFAETDPLNIKPVERVGEGGLDDGTEIDTSSMEIVR